MYAIFSLETSISLSSDEYFAHENLHQVALLLTSSSASSTVFEVELHVTQGTATSKNRICIISTAVNYIITRY